MYLRKIITNEIALLLLAVFSSATGYGQTQEVVGTVTDPTNSPLPGVTVLEKGTSNGVITDVEGSYSLTVSSDTATLIFSYLGFADQEISINNQSVVDVVLQESSSELDEVVVIGYGTVKKSDLTGSVSSLNVEDINKVPAASVTQNFAGRTPGINVTSNSGAPGAGVKIRIRGINSLQGNNDPLFVIDGVPVPSSGQQSGNFNADPLAGINPGDIENIEVLKDASAVAIYGSRGANGVILITTKSGKAGKTKVTVDAYYGVQSEIAQYDVVSAAEFARFRNLAVANAEQDLFTYTDEEIANFEAGAGTTWRDEVLRDAAIHNTQVSLSGGTDQVTYFISGNYFEQEGILQGSGFDRVSIKPSLTVTINSSLKVGTDLVLSQSEYYGDFGNSQNSSFGGGYVDLYSAPPTFPVLEDDGRYFQANPLSGFPFPNPVENAREVQRDQTSLRFLGNIYAEYNITPELQFKQVLGTNYNANNIRQYLPTFTQRSELEGRGSQSNVLSKTLLSTTTLSYNNTFAEKHNVNAVLGYELQDNEDQSFGGEARDFANDNTGYYNLQAGGNLFSLNSGYVASGLQSFLGRFNYNYDSRYFVTFTGRYDGSSKFQGDNQYSFFPSVALAWTLSNEGFLSDSELITNLKLRGSYGQTGSQAIPAYRTLNLIGTKNDGTVNGINSTIGYFPQRIPNPDLTWETTTQYDVGLDMELLAGRINLTADFYHKVTDDLLLDFPLPFTTGFNTVLSNAGSVENQGIDLSLNTVNVSTGGFTWQTNVNVSFFRNEIVDLGGREFIIRAPSVARAFGSGSFNTGIAQVGQPIGAFYVLEEDGIIANQAELDAAPTYGSIGIGKKRYVDQDGDGQITADDRVIAGNAQPDFTGGLLNNLSYRGFDLSFFFEFSVGNELLNATRYYLERPSGDNNITREYYNNFLGSPNPNSSNTYPAPESVVPNLSIDDTYVEDGSYARLTNITLGYSLPSSVVEAIPISGLRLYVNANNLWTITNYRGLDPNSSVFGNNEYGAGIDYSAYPTAKSVVVGINLQL